MIKSSKLLTKWLGQNWYWVESVGSTMEWAAKLCQQGAVHGTVCGADCQTSGRGRLNRDWISPSDAGIYCSMIFKPHIAPADLWVMTFLTAVAVAEILTRDYGLDAKIKWPNDILIDGKKIAGILTQSQIQGNGVESVIVGLGINVNMPTIETLPLATSMSCLKNQQFDRQEILIKVLHEIEFWYEDWQKQGANGLVKRWKTLSDSLGKYVTITESQRVISGRALDVEKGALVLEQADGQRILCHSGEI